MYNGFKYYFFLTEMKSYKNFKTELSRLRQLYFTAKYSSHETDSSISRKLKNGELDGSEKLYFDDRQEEIYLISSSIFALRHRLKNQLLRYLRELIFIRAISALEVVLVDFVQEIFVTSKEPFKTNAIYEIPQGELLSAESLSDLFSNLINKHCRTLHSAGFIEVKKYYLKTFGLNFNDYTNNISKIIEYHDRRHLLVHQLGSTDIHYRKKYDTKIKKLTVDESYLLESIDLLMAFADNLNQKIENTFTTTQTPSTDELLMCNIIAIVESDFAKSLFLPSFQFWADNRLSFLRDISISLQYLDEHNIELNLKGNRLTVKNYVKILKKHHKAGDLTLVSVNKQNLGPHKVKPCQLSREDIDKVRKSLPDKPWPVSIHKTIAQNLGLKSSEVYSALDLIISEEKKK